jgi:hypothetical protein
MSALKDPLRNEDFAELDSAARTALAQQLDSLAEWNRAMALYVANYQIDVIATFRSALASKWHRLWTLFAIEGCISLFVTVLGLIALALLTTLAVIGG